MQKLAEINCMHFCLIEFAGTFHQFQNLWVSSSVVRTSKSHLGSDSWCFPGLGLFLDHWPGSSNRSLPSALSQSHRTDTCPLPYPSPTDHIPAHCLFPVPQNRSLLCSLIPVSQNRSLPTALSQPHRTDGCPWHSCV